MNWGAVIFCLIVLGILAFGIGCAITDWYESTKNSLEKRQEELDKIDKEQ